MAALAPDAPPIAPDAGIPGPGYAGGAGGGPPDPEMLIEVLPHAGMDVDPATIPDIPGMTALFRRMHFTASTANYLVSPDGEALDCISKLHSFQDADAAALACNLRKPGGSITVPRAGRGHGRMANPGYQVSLLAVKALKRGSFYIRYMHNIGRNITPTDVNPENWNELETLYVEQRDYKKPEESTLPKPKAEGEDYVRYQERTIQAFDQRRGSGMMFLSTYLREDPDVLPDFEDPPESYDSKRAELCSRAPHNSATAKADNAILAELFERMIKDHPGLVYAKPYFRKRDGRGAYRAFFDNYLGENASDIAHSKSLKKVQTLTYRHEGRHFNFDRYGDELTKNFDILETLHNRWPDRYESVSERSKVTYLMKGIKNPRLIPITITLKANKELRKDFKKALDFYKQFIKDDVDEVTNVTVAQVHTNSNGNTDEVQLTKADIRYYKRKEWLALPQKVRDAIIARRPPRKRGRNQSKYYNKSNSGPPNGPSGGYHKKHFNKFQKLGTQIAALNKKMDNITVIEPDGDTQSLHNAVTERTSNRNHPALRRNRPKNNGIGG